MDSTPDDGVTNRSVLPGLPNQVAWPNTLSVQFSTYLGVVGVVLGAVSLILTGLQPQDLGTRIGIFVLCLALPFIVQVSWIYGRVIWRRARQYDQIYSAAEQNIKELNLLRANVVDLVEALVAAGLETFRIANITMRGGIVLLLIESQNATSLDIGLNLLVVDSLNLDMLGWFVISEQTAGGYFARQSTILNAIWWGLLHREASKHLRVDVNAMAILLPHKRGEGK